MPSLFVIQGRDQGKRFELDASVSGLGRDTSNTILLHDTEVSRRHAEIHAEVDEFTLVDLESSNGTFVNSKRVRRTALKMGDRVQVGRTLMIYTGGDEQSSAGPPTSIEIVTRQSDDGSRIIRSVSQEEGSQVFAIDGESPSPWLARARSNLQVMYRTALAVSHTLDIDQLLHRIIDLIFEWVEADRGCIMLVDLETGELSPRVRRNRRGQQTDERIEISRTILDYVMEHTEGVLTSDAREDDRWDPGGSIVNMGVREAICVPLQGRYGVVGVIYIDTYTPPGRVVQDRSSDKFSEEHLKLMVAIGHQAALAVEDTSYYSALVQAERLAAMGQTIATLSHHVKNILQGIRGGSYLIEEGLKLNEQSVVRKGWRIVDKNQEKISNLVMDMLTFSKERDPEFAPADLNEVTAEVVELMQVRAADAEVQLEWRPDAKLPVLTFDVHAMHQAILNVVTNAIDACEKQPNARVTVSTRLAPDQRMACVEVRDNGEGIPPDDIKAIFSVFESRKGSRGTGLGLPVSRKILREHQGEIRVESAPGEGSCFVLELPARLAEPSGPPRSTSDTLS